MEADRLQSETSVRLLRRREVYARSILYGRRLVTGTAHSVCHPDPLLRQQLLSLVHE